MFSIKQKATQTAKRAGLMAGGFVLCAIGLGFFTLAAWFGLLVEFSPLQAALILGAAYFGLGLVLVGLCKNSGNKIQRVENAASAPPPDAPPLVQALMFGIQAGMNASKPKR